MLLIATGYSHSSDHIPGWIVLACYSAMGLGTMFGGWRIVKTMGNRITKLNQARGFCANSGGAVTLFVATAFGIPVSTTHTITGPSPVSDRRAAPVVSAGAWLAVSSGRGFDHSCSAAMAAVSPGISARSCFDIKAACLSALLVTLVGLVWQIPILWERASSCFWR